MTEKNCPKCETVKDLSCFGGINSKKSGFRYQSYCKPCRVRIAVARKKANPEKNRASQKRAKLMQNYGITIEQRDAQWLAQGGRCAICAKALLGLSPQTVHVDHCHATGALRGILCGPCNTGLGSFKDRPEVLLAAIDYLRTGGVWPVACEPGSAKLVGVA